jgi:prophage regulatory protein
MFNRREAYMADDVHSNPQTVSTRAAVSQSVEAATHPDALLRVPTVVTLTGISKTTIYSKVAIGEFPRPVRLGHRCTRFRAGDVVAWLKAQST